MSDNDLIKYGDVRVKVESAIEVLNNLGLAWEIYSPLWDAIDAIRDISTIPQEMSAREYHLIKRRMCKNCPVCPLNEAAINLFIDCKRFEREYPEKAVALVENWAEEHPEERSE